MSKNHLHTFDLIGDAGLAAIESAVRFSLDPSDLPR
jgi:hypothetical protein